MQEPTTAAEQDDIFVGRGPELARLLGLLDRALAGRGQVCFVAGEPGAGKTVLVSEFASQALERHTELVTVAGGCDAQTGEGDAYLPFREILGTLAGGEPKGGKTGSAGENLRRLKQLLILTGEALIEIGPDLIGLFVPAASLVAKAGQFMVEKTEWSDKLRERFKRGDPEGLVPKEGLDQSQIFEQYTRVLESLSRKKPILLVVEDLQWADAASVGLLFRLGRRLEDSRILVVGTYRPNDVALGRDGDRHPLVPVLTEMKRYRGDVVIDLDSAQRERGRAFVDAYLDAELNCLDNDFRRALYQHTGGHALFTVELVQHLRDDGSLVQDEAGCWTEGPGLDWSHLPSRVEGVIEERIGRLAADLRECLTVAAVEGEQFTAEVVAHIESMEVRNLVRRLSGELHKAHHLVESQGVERVGRQRLSIYRFSHNLMQAYLYGSLDEVQVAYLHEDVGLALESLYGDDARRIAIQLARHFELAELADPARRYLKIAAEQTAASYANTEALALVGRALALTPEDEPRERFDLLLLREHLLGIAGDRAAQERDLETLLGLAREIGEPRLQAEVALRQAAFHLQTGRIREAAQAAEASAGLAVRAGDMQAEARAEHRWGRAFWQAGDYVTSKPHLERALALSREGQSALDEARALYDLGVVDHYQDDFERAVSRLAEAARLYEEAGEERGRIRCLSMEGIILDVEGHHTQAQERFRQATEICRRLGWRYAEARVLAQSAGSRFELAGYEASQEDFERAIAIGHEIGDEEIVATSTDTLGLIAYLRGEPAAARDLFARALALHQAAGNLRGQAYALTHLGYTLAGLEDWSAARGALERALAIRREAGSRGLELDALAGLALCAVGQGELGRAGSYIEEILATIEAHGPVGVEFPVQVYLVCARVLSALAAQDDRYAPRARAVVEAGAALLRERADQIAEPALREQFLHRNPVHAEMLELEAGV